MPFTLSVIYAEYHLCRVSFLLINVANKPFMLSVIMLNVVMLSVVMLSIIYAEGHFCSVSFMLSVVMLSVVMLSVVVPFLGFIRKVINDKSFDRNGPRACSKYFYSHS